MIFVRVESGLKIGIGHVMRCLNLCKSLIQLDNNLEIKFICRNHDSNIINKISELFYTYILPLKINVTLEHQTWLGTNCEDDYNDVIKIFQKQEQNIKLLIIDHYGIDYKWERKVRSYVDSIFVIDDIFDRQHECDFLLDQNLYFNDPYINLVPKRCQIFLGPKYAILNSDFKKLKIIESRSDKINRKKRINISFGGSDIYNITQKVIDIILENKYKINNFDNIIFDIIIGASSKNYENIKNIVKSLKNFNIYYSINNMAELLNLTDLCIGATGTSMYERLYLRIPTIAITVAENQINIAQNLDKINSIKYLGHYNNINYDNIIYYINNYLNSNISIQDLKINSKFDKMIYKLLS